MGQFFGPALRATPRGQCILQELPRAESVVTTERLIDSIITMNKKQLKKKDTNTIRKAAPRRSRPSPEASADGPPSFALGISTRSAVYGCIRTVTGDPNLIITPEMGVAALGVRRTDLGACLNQQLGLRDEDRYRGDEIGGDWIVQDVINDADGRRH